LIAGGVEARRLDAAGFGQERPVTSNATDEGRAKNRRTELVVTKK
jgi:flagellar motor protein MotB